MRFRLNHIMALLGAAAVATAIAAAPTAAAAPAAPSTVATAPTAPSDPSDPAQAQSCTNMGGTQTECQSPGNVQLNDSPPQVDYFPYGGGAS
ncbi:hypothetical protein HNP02_008645 [Mycobacterium sp. AZCC_0083]|nr:hypothetical protein [Mycobacterium sp. AZCC_0083]